MYRCNRRKKSQGQLIVLPGGSAQMSERMKVAQEAWGKLRVVDAEDLPQFDDEVIEPITADEVRRVVTRLADGTAKGVDSW
eukprot:12875415-Heterocapsa_arctica.AAC.1